MEQKKLEIAAQIVHIEVNALTSEPPITHFVITRMTLENGSGQRRESGWLMLDEPMARSLVEMLQSKLPPLAPSAVPPTALQ